MITHIAAATVPTRWGEFVCHAYRRPDGIEHLALVLGALDGEPLVRVHSECLTGDVFASARCDCGAQRDLALELIAAEGCGALVYLRGQEGRGIGLRNMRERIAAVGGQLTVQSQPGLTRITADLSGSAIRRLEAVA